MSKQDVLTDGYATCGPTACVPEKDTSTPGSSEPGLGSSLSWHLSAVLRSLKVSAPWQRLSQGLWDRPAQPAMFSQSEKQRPEWVPGLAGVFLLSPIAVGLGPQSPFPRPCFLRGPTAMAPSSPVDSDCTWAKAAPGPTLQWMSCWRESQERWLWAGAMRVCVGTERAKSRRKGAEDRWAAMEGRARPAKAPATLPAFLLPQSP